MLDLRPVENIIFDLGGVILNIDYQLTSKAFKEIGFDSFDDFYTQQQQTDLFDLFETGKISSTKFIEKVTEFIPQCTEKEVIEAWNAMLLDLPKNRIQLITELRKEYRVFLLSNTNEIHEIAFRKIVEDQFGVYIFDNVFEDVYLSHRIGQRKPNKDCFEYVLGSNGLKAENTLFIDDSIQHIEGAKKVGLKTFHLQQGKDIIQLFPDKFRPAFRL